MPADELRTLAKRPALWAGLAALAACGYGYAMSRCAVGIDDLAIDTYMGGVFLLQSRVTEYLLGLTGLLNCQPFWPELFAAVCLALAGMVLAAVVYAAAHRAPSTGGALLLAGGLLLFPFHAEAFAYSNLILTAFGLLLAAAALALCMRHILQGGGILPALAGCVCLAFSLGCYESMAQAWLTLVAVLLFTDAAFAPKASRRWHWWALPLVRGLWPLAAGLVLRAGLSRALCLALGVTGSDGAAAKTIYWTRRGSAAEALRIFLREFLCYYGARALAVPALALVLLACLGLVVWTAVRRRGNGCGVLAAGLLLTVFAMGILQGTGSQMARASQSFAVFVPFVCWLAVQSRPRLPAAALAAALLAVECLALNAAFRADRVRWQYEETLLRTAAAQLDALNPDRTLPVAFAGVPELPDEVTRRLPEGHPAYKAEWVLSVTLGMPMGDLYPYEEVTHSVIEWAQSAFGGHEQMYLLMDYIGRPCVRCTPEQQAAADAAELAPGTVTALENCLVVQW